MLQLLFSVNAWRIYLLICLIAIEYLATTKIHIEIVENIWDKSNHFIAFFTLYILLSFAYRNLSRVVRFVLLIAFGLQIEIVQELIGRSHFSTLDVLADSIGLLIGFLLIWVLGTKKVIPS